jgi:hypothetical protein
VADSANHAVEKLSSSGKLLASWVKAASAATSFQTPSAIVLDQQGDLDVADPGTEGIRSVAGSVGHGDHGTPNLPVPAVHCP